MGKILALLCVTILCVQHCTGYIIIGAYSKVPHKDPKNRGTITKALRNVNINIADVKILSFYVKNNHYKTSYKLTYKNEKGELCFMKFKSYSFFSSPNPAPPACTDDGM